MEEIILNLRHFWKDEGCVNLESFDQEVGAGTLSIQTAMHCIAEKNFSICYPQISTRPTDARFAQNPNRISSYYQFQVVLKPAEDFENIQGIFLNSLKTIGIEVEKHDIRFIEDDWQNESIGATGLGYEVWCDGMEISQFTYIQSIGGINCDVISCEITYGIERIAMYVQNKESIFDIIWSQNKKQTILYRDVSSELEEIDRSNYFTKFSEDTIEIKRRLDYALENISKILNSQMPITTVAYRQCLSASHMLNILDARGEISPDNRMETILKIRNLVNKCFLKHIELQKNKNI